MDFEFLKSQFTPLPYPTHSFKGLTIIVTGANVGLGLEAARHFARLGAGKVILGCRSLSRGEAACRDIERSTGRTGVCETWMLDLADFRSVQEFSVRAKGLERLDVVVENAGVVLKEFEVVEGMERTVAVNVVGTFLMALEMLPVLRASGEKTGVVPRLVIVTSEVHAWSKLDERNAPSIFEELKQNNPTHMSNRYPTTKLLEVFAVRQLAAAMRTSPTHARSPPVVLNMVNPGLCHSSLSRSITGIAGLFFALMKLVLARRTEVGARTLVAAAAAGDESHGMYMSDCVVRPPGEFVRSEEGGKTEVRVWDELKGVLEGIEKGVVGNI